MKEFKLTVRDVLSRDSFKCAKVVAGEAGLERQVKWSHVLEVKEFESLINGGEMILTTGVGLQLDLPTQLNYVTSLIERDAACICIEMGLYFKEIPPAIIELANQKDFPIIIFENAVRFVDLTQDLHTFIINQHHQMLSQLDTLSRKFIALSLTPNGILKVLQELHHFFGENVLFITDDTKPYYYPLAIKELEVSIRNYLETTTSANTEQRLFTFNDQTFALMPVRGLGQIWGYLCLHVGKSHSNEFTFLLLDRAALAIAQILLRNRTIEERKQKNENEIVRNLLNGRHVEQSDLQNFLPSASRNLHYRVFLIQIDYTKANWNEDNWEEIKLQRSLMIRSLFKRHGFFPAVSSKKGEIAVIASFIAAEHLKKDTGRFTQIIHSILETKKSDFFDWKECTFGISMVYKEMSDVTRAYKEANDVISLQEMTMLDSFFYEDLGIFRVLIPLKKSGYLEKYIQDYLGPIIEADKKMDSDLLETLSVYLKQMGSKKEAAERLFIVRQTLYHRLEKLQQLLGDDFMEPTNRLAIETAIKAYELVNGKIGKQEETGITS